MSDGFGLGLNTFHSIHNRIYDSADRILDIGHHPTHKLIGNSEDPSAEDHWVNVTEINASWEKRMYIFSSWN